MEGQAKVPPIHSCTHSPMSHVPVSLHICTCHLLTCSCSSTHLPPASRPFLCTPGQRVHRSTVQSMPALTYPCALAHLPSPLPVSIRPLSIPTAMILWTYIKDPSTSPSMFTDCTHGSSPRFLHPSLIHPSIHGLWAAIYPFSILPSTHPPSGQLKNPSPSHSCASTATAFHTSRPAAVSPLWSTKLSSPHAHLSSFLSHGWSVLQRASRPLLAHTPPRPFHVPCTLLHLRSQQHHRAMAGRLNRSSPGSQV